MTDPLLKADAAINNLLDQFDDLKERISILETYRMDPDIPRELVYNVKDYGAIGDGVTDDGGPIQVCINALSDGTSIYFPEGNYKYTVTPSFVTLNSIHVSGPGILKPSACNGLSFDDCEDLIIDGLRLDATQAGNTYIGINLLPDTGNIRQAVIKNCHLSGFKFGIKLTDSTATVGNTRMHDNWIELTGSGLAGSIGIWVEETDNKIYDNTIQYYETGIALDAASQLVRGNHIWAPAAASPDADISIKPGATVRGMGFVIANNYLDGSPSSGHLLVNVQGAGGVTIADNYFRASDSMTEYIAFVNGDATTDIQDIVIIGNVTVNASGGSIEFLSFTGVQTDDSENYRVYGNTFGSQVTPYSTSSEVRQVGTYAASYAPNPMLGRLLELTLTGNITIGKPTNVIMGGIGNQITYLFIQDGTGGRTVAWHANYKQGWSDTGNTAGLRSTITFEWDGTNWNQVCAQSPYI